MEFSFTDEQIMIQETAANFLAEVSTSSAIRSAMSSDLGYDQEVWQQVCEELCLHTILIPEEFGGLGLGFVELSIVLEEMGRYLFCSPYLSTACMATSALLVAGTREQKEKYFAQIISGKTASLAFCDATGSWDETSISAAYTSQGDDFLISGEYRYVIDAAHCNFMIIAARQKGTSGNQGVSLFIVDVDNKDRNKSSDKLQITLLPTVDQTRKLAHVRLKNLKVPKQNCMRLEGQARPLLKTILQLSSVGLSAEQSGGAQKVLDMTVEYLSERSQFNRQLASFQALKHKAADMQLKSEVSKSAIYYAACVAEEKLNCLLEGDQESSISSQLNEASSMAKAYCSDAFMFNAGCALQMHGGVGFTWEYDVHLYFKRAKASQHLLGDANYHKELLAKILLDDETQISEEAIS